MKIQTNRAELLTELVPMQGVVERKSTIPVLSHLLLRVKDGRLHLAATDLDVSLVSWCEAEVEEEGAVAVQARKFLEIVRAVAGETVELTLEDSNDLRIVSGNSRFKIRGLSSDDFPTLPEVSDAELIGLEAQAFRSMVGKIFFAVSAEESRFQLNGALFKPKAGGFELVATDGYRLALVETKHEGVEEAAGVLIPRKALQELLRFDSDGDLEFRRGQHHLSFRHGRRDLICRILEGTFPDYEKVIAKDNEHHVVFDRKVLADVVARVALLTGDRARAVKLAFREGSLTVSAANPDLGEATEELPCDFEGDELVLGLNPDYVGQFLTALETEQVRFSLKDEKGQCLGSPVDGEDERYLCVIMPIRL